MEAGTYSEKRLHFWVDFDIHASQTCDADLLEFIRRRVDVNVRPEDGQSAGHYD
jgi:hypothetical protein